ncbi:hypothetical protein GWI33_019908 [Rhynchophorus ferrugineus]|uniref:Transmembrane protein 62 n=1 Tax=Rhynchophorus ferrugineus TaxID=354439 RepID=A0A834I4F2_RHYFE|nr:hypothetical protein GWI33_019908 [Rhynchophorus ferrugineus]
MKIVTVAACAFFSMIFISVILGSFISFITTSTVHPDDYPKEKIFKIADKFDNLIWFIQISDIHISIFRDPSRITEFKEFCDYTIDRIKPSVVLASGDLTDAKTKDSIGSQQYESEWRHYRDILKEHDIGNKTLWLDIRGNHDNFNGRAHPRSYLVQTRKGNSLYSFLGVDACLEPGPRRPFNFVGIVDESEVTEINQLIKKIKETGSNYTIWFGHFPTSCILSSAGENVRDLIKKDENSLVYVCGHLHTLGGAVKNMYTMQKEGHLELELGDWKDNRLYRLMAIDHGMFSFIDIKHRDWPVVLLTNPKHTLFINPLKENVINIRESTHIRVLAFSLSRIKVVRIRINNEPWTDLKHIKGPLYVVNWDPQRYLHGLHNIEVYAKDIEGREKTDRVPFSLDGSKVSFGVLPRLLLMSNLSCIFWSVFICTLVAYLIPLFVLKYFHKMVEAGYADQPKLRGNFLKNFVRRTWILTTVDRIFWPIVLYPMYLVFGPWTIGYIIEDYVGIIFSWGILINGSFLPGAFTYVYGFIQLITFQIPLSVILINTVKYRLSSLSAHERKRLSLKQKLFLHLPFCLVFTIQVIMAYLFWLAYGTLAFILGPLRTWSLVLAAVLYYMALNLPEKCFKKAKDICFTKSEPSIDSSSSRVASDKSAGKGLDIDRGSVEN